MVCGPPACHLRGAPTRYQPISLGVERYGSAKGRYSHYLHAQYSEAIVAMLACARIGAIHSAVFAGFSVPALRGRIEDVCSKIALIVDESVSGGKAIPMRRIVDEALSMYDKDHLVQCLVLKRTGSPIPSPPGGSDHWWHGESAQWPNYIAPEPMDSEDPLYLLYISGSMGKPKGLLHSMTGYLLNLHPSDTMFCAGDVGWIAGNSYLVHVPLYE